MKKVIWLLACMLLSISFAYAQNKTVSGVVVDEKGVSVIGATVVAKGTTIGTVTGMNGEFSVDVPQATTTLTVSFMGMTDYETPAGTNLRITLKATATGLKEVEITGYGVQQRGTFTGAASVVRSEKLAAPVTSFDKALQGNAAGVLSLSNSGQPGAGQSVTIRGIGSINAGTIPLYVVDGIPIATGNFGQMTQTAATETSDNLSAMANINPADIESIVVLKDASATSIYGSRASNGVVLITTKRGSEGKTNFDLKVARGYSNRTTKNFTVFNGDQYIDYLNDAFFNAGYGDRNDPNEYITMPNGQKIFGEILNSDKMFPLRQADGNFFNYDWMDQAYVNNAPTTSFDLSASGGTARTKFFTSISYLDQEGVVLNTGMKRMSARLNLDQQVNSKFKFGINANFSYNDQESPYTSDLWFINPIMASMNTSPLDPGIIPEGSLFYDAASGMLLPVNPGVNIHYMSSQSTNFLANTMYDDFSSRTSRLLTSGYAQWDIIEGLIFKTTAGLDYMFLNEYKWLDSRPVGNSASYGQGTAANSVVENRIWNVTNTLNYITSFDAHSFVFLLGQEAQATDYKWTYAMSQGFPGTRFHQISEGALPYGTNGTRNESSIASFFANANYNFDEKYFLSGSFRRDGSSRLSSDNRWGNFWSVGASWRLTQENFMQDFDWLTNATLRTSYGTAGNTSGIDPYASRGLYGAGFNYNENPGAAPVQIANPDLGWETSNSFNIGLDLSFFQGRLGGTIEFYNKKTDNLLLDKPLSLTTGFDFITSNIGSMQNRGVEFSLNAIPIITQNFTWKVDFNITHNKNEILKLLGGEPIIIAPFIYQEGSDIQTYFSRNWAGVNPANGRPMYYDLNGNIVYDLSTIGDVRHPLGSAAPKFYGGLTNTFEFYGFDVSFMLYFTYGNKVFNSTWSFATHCGYNRYDNQYEGVDERWRKEGDISEYPQANANYTAGVYGGYASDRVIFDASYIRLRDITIGYTLPKSITNRMNLNTVRVYAQGTNMLTFSHYPDADPEVGLSGEYAAGYPNAKTITFGLNVKF